MTTINPDFPLVDISGSERLPLLPVGNHSITVYGKWTASVYQGPNQPFDKIELAQTTLNFTVQDSWKSPS
jgi:hypothetical protein